MRQVLPIAPPVPYLRRSMCHLARVCKRQVLGPCARFLRLNLFRSQTTATSARIDEFLPMRSKVRDAACRSARVQKHAPVDCAPAIHARDRPHPCHMLKERTVLRACNSSKSRCTADIPLWTRSRSRSSIRRNNRSRPGDLATSKPKAAATSACIRPVEDGSEPPHHRTVRIRFENNVTATSFTLAQPERAWFYGTSARYRQALTSLTLRSHKQKRSWSSFSICCRNLSISSEGIAEASGFSSTCTTRSRPVSLSTTMR